MQSAVTQGVVGIIITAPFYGSRRPDNQKKWFLRQVRRASLPCLQLPMNRHIGCSTMHAQCTRVPNLITIKELCIHVGVSPVPAGDSGGFGGGVFAALGPRDVGGSPCRWGGQPGGHHGGVHGPDLQRPPGSDPLHGSRRARETIYRRYY